MSTLYRHIAKPASLWIIFLLVFTLHNTEEVIYRLPAWADAYMPLPPFFSQWSFTLTAVLLTVAAALTGYVLVRRKASQNIATLRLFCIIMVINALSHLGLCIVTGTLMPGIVTSVTLLLPVYLWVLYVTK